MKVTAYNKFHGSKVVRVGDLTTETGDDVRALALAHAGETDDDETGKGRSHWGVKVNRFDSNDGLIAVVTINTD